MTIKTSWRWLLRIAGLLVLAVAAGIYFRYEYTADKSVRVDRFTGRQEVFCAATQTWASLAQCYPAMVQPDAASGKNQ